MEFVKVEQPPFYPKQCVCGNQHGPMADTGIERPLGLPQGREGDTAVSPVVHVYLCERCIRTAGHLFGMVEHVTHEKLRHDYGTLLVSVDRLEGELEAVKPVLDAARAHAQRELVS